MRPIRIYIVDLTKTRGKGEFGCPRCGMTLSPDDRTNDAYTILEPVMSRGQLEKVALQCNKCGSRICLTGFGTLVV